MSFETELRELERVAAMLDDSFIRSDKAIMNGVRNSAVDRMTRVLYGRNTGIKINVMNIDDARRLEGVCEIVLRSYKTPTGNHEWWSYRNNRLKQRIHEIENTPTHMLVCFSPLLNDGSVDHEVLYEGTFMGLIHKGKEVSGILVKNGGLNKVQVFDLEDVKILTLVTDYRHKDNKNEEFDVEESSQLDAVNVMRKFFNEKRKVISSTVYHVLGDAVDELTLR